MTTPDELEAERGTTRRLMICNVIGLIMAFCLTGFLYLWGSGVLLHGPKKTCVVQDFLQKNQPSLKSDIGLPSYYNMSQEQGWPF